MTTTRTTTTRTAPMTTDDPWRGIDPPTEGARISARRVPDSGTPDWGLYWALDSRHQCLLILQHRSGHSSRRLPRLRGLRVEAQPTEEEAGQRLIIRLTDGEQREVFHRFCVDIVDATRPSRSEAEAVERFLGRTWRWHRLLRGGGDGRLSLEEQKGLIGELCVLERQLIPTIGPADAVRAWTGPVGAPKDFQVGWIGIEAKTHSPHVPSVRISSAEQLDTAGTARLFLHIVEVSGAPDDTESVTITDIASRVRGVIAALDMSAAIQFEERLNATGFDWNDDYSDSPLLIGDASLYEVLEGFPRVTPPMFQPGVEDVRYSVVLSRCESFRVDMTVLIQAISGEADGS